MLIIVIKNTLCGLKSISTDSLTKLRSVFLTKQIASRFSQHWRGKSRKRTLVSCLGHQTRCQGPFSNVSSQFWEDRLTNCSVKKTVTRRKLNGLSGLIVAKIRQLISKMQWFMSDRLLNFDKSIAKHKSLKTD